MLPVCDQVPVLPIVTPIPVAVSWALMLKEKVLPDRMFITDEVIVTDTPSSVTTTGSRTALIVMRLYDPTAFGGGGGDGGGEGATVSPPQATRTKATATVNRLIVFQSLLAAERATLVRPIRPGPLPNRTFSVPIDTALEP